MMNKITPGRLAAKGLPVNFLWFQSKRGTVLAALIVCVLWALCFGTGREALADEARVSKGIYVQGIDCAGMTAAEVGAAIESRLQELRQTTVTLQVDGQSASCTLGELGLDWTNREILQEVLNLGATGNIVRRYKDRKDLENQNRQFQLDFTADDAMVAAVVKGLKRFNTEPVNASIYTRDDLTPGVDGGIPGIKVRVKKTQALLKSAVASWDGSSPLSVEVPCKKEQPDVPYEELAIVSDVLGTATTDYSASSWGRAVNVENGCRKISGTLLYPGESFSVTAAVTPFTAENGYEQAPSYEENRVVDSYGGGICQVSTTLYNAVLKSELEVTSRSNHTMVVAYVPLSKDAAIAEGVMDMSFVNTKDEPIYIIGSAYGGTLTFSIYGHETRPANRSLEFESRTIQTIEPTQSKMFANAGQSVGYINQTQSPHTGYVAELWKNVYVDGQLVDSVQVNSSNYTAVGTIYDVGVASPYPAVTQAMNTAIASGNLANVQAVIASAAQIQQQAESEAAAQAAAQQAAAQAAAQEAAAQAAQQAGAQAQQEQMVIIGEGGDVDESLSGGQ